MRQSDNLRSLNNGVWHGGESEVWRSLSKNKSENEKWTEKLKMDKIVGM